MAFELDPDVEQALLAIDFGRALSDEPRASAQRTTVSDGVYQDYKDIVIETLTAENYNLHQWVASLAADVDAYRTLAVEGIHALHHVTSQRDRLRTENRELRDRETA